jgi:hypothetical protein
MCMAWSSSYTVRLLSSESGYGTETGALEVAAAPPALIWFSSLECKQGGELESQFAGIDSVCSAVCDDHPHTLQGKNRGVTAWQGKVASVNNSSEQGGTSGQHNPQAPASTQGSATQACSRTKQSAKQR